MHSRGARILEIGSVSLYAHNGIARAFPLLFTRFSRYAVGTGQSLEGNALMQLSLSTRTIDGIIVVDCAGRLVLGEESARLREVVRKFIPVHRQIVLNMRDITFIDSGGVGTLISLYTSIRSVGGEMKLASLSARTLELLHITKLLTVFDIRDTETDAVLSFARSA